jgi:hypothetical protein
MVPADYRLDTVAARLIERLEAVRPTFGTDGEAAYAAFREHTESHLDAAIAEFREMVPDEDPDEHAAFLRREILEIALPRFHRHAMAYSAGQANNFGFGPLGEPAGRIALFAFSLFALVVIMPRLIEFPISWPLLLLDLVLPFSPTIAVAIARRRYAARLQELVTDMGRIQDSERTYASASVLRKSREISSEQPRPRPPERQREGQ